ncbi:MAG: glycosyltransferase family 4 protein [Alphaproteobacteria bacterium]
MRFVVHDYPAHAFPLQLCRWLAGRGHHLLHLSSPAVGSPRGDVSRRPDDPPTLQIEPVVGRHDRLDKYSLVRRARQEWDYGGRLARRVRSFRPDAILAGNASPLIQRRLLTAARRCDARFVYWLQDIYAEAAARVAIGGATRVPGAVDGRRRRALLGRLVGAVEYGVLRASAAVITISPDHVPLLIRHGINRQAVTIIENWASLNDVQPGQKANGWSRPNGLADRFVLLYAGTLGLKHDPAIRADLADDLAGDNAVVAVVSEGRGRDWLEQEKARRGLEGLRLFDFAPAFSFSDVLASGDVLLAVLEHDAGAFSVPSKVLSYLCAGRPILATLPTENLAARRLLESGAGVVVAPGERLAMADQARRLMADQAQRIAMGKAGRAFAEQAFDMDRIGQRFEALLAGGKASAV